MNTNVVSQPLFYVVASFVGIAIIAIEFYVFLFLVNVLKLHTKLSKPKEIVVLMGMEIVTLLLSIQDLRQQSLVLAYSSIFLAIKLIGLYGVKKWVVYFYLLSTAVSWGITYFSVSPKDYNIVLFGLLGGSLLLAFYYFKVYVPNKKLFV